MFPQTKSRANLGRIYSRLVSIFLRTFRARVTCATLGTEVSELTLGCLTVAGPTIPLAADLFRPPTGLPGLFLFAGTNLVSGPVVLEVSSFEVTEPSDISKLNVLDFPNIPSDCLVQVNDLGIRVGKGSKKLKDIFGVYP